MIALVSTIRAGAAFRAMSKTAYAIVALVISCGCTSPDSGGVATRDTIAENLEFLTREGCVNTELMQANLDERCARLAGR